MTAYVLVDGIWELLILYPLV